MDRKLHFQLLNIGHALDHYFILIFPTVVLFLTDVWTMSYSDLLKIGSVGVFAYGAGALPAGWLADKIGRSKMMIVFFIGIGAASICAGLTNSPSQLAIALAFVGIFAAIYHPVGLPLVYSTAGKAGRLLAINGVAGNLGLAVAAMITTYLASSFSWRAAFIVPGIVSVICGAVYTFHFSGLSDDGHKLKKSSDLILPNKGEMLTIFSSIILIATFGGLVFNSITTALPKILMESAAFSNKTIKEVGMVATFIFASASLTQLVIGELMEKVKPQILLMAVCAIQACILLTASTMKSPIILLIVLLFATFGQIPINDWLTGRFSSNEWRSRFFAMRYTLGLGVSSVAYWLIATVHSEGNGFADLLQILGLVMIPAFFCSLIIVATMEKMARKHARSLAKEM